MSAILPPTGVLSYNGYVFDGAIQVTAATKLVRDDAERTVLYHEITITVKAIVHNAFTTNDDILDLRRKLGEQGKSLIWTGQGHGNDLIVNVAGGVGDVKWGPKPEVISWTPIGGAQACEIEWRVTTCVSVCDQAGSPRFRGIMAFNYSVSYDVSLGYTTRTVSGYLEIAQTREGRSVPDTADNYRHLIAPVVPLKFRRESTTWSLSADKSRLDFTIRDAEVRSPNAFPNGVVDASGSHRVSWSRRETAVQHNRITLELEMAADRPMAEAYAYMLLLVDLRRGDKTKSILLSVDVEEDLFSRRASFSVGWRRYGTVGDILVDSSLWTPIGTLWHEWLESMGLVFQNRGYAQLFHQPGSDAIVDLCGAQGAIPWDAQPIPLGQPQQGHGQGLVNQQPAPAQSWLHYENHIEIRRRRPTALQSPIQSPDTDTQEWNPNDAQGTNYPAPAGSDAIIQVGGRSAYFAVMRGRAVRAGFEIPRPVLLAVGGQPATEIGGRFSQVRKGKHLGVEVYSAVWEIEYALPNSPGRLPPMVNFTDPPPS